MSYYLAPSLVKLRNEVNKKFPKRDKTSDGWIGDTSHAARPSDHNPDWNAGGVVRAIDIDVDDNDPGRDLRLILLNAAKKDKRVYYVITNGYIYSRTYGFAKRKYTGPNPHFTHVHISIRKGKEFEDSKVSWLNKLPGVSLTNVRTQFVNARDGKPIRVLTGVKRVQSALNAKNGEKLVVDGKVGKATLNAWGRWERKVGRVGAPRIPDKETLTKLGQNRFRVTK